MHCRLNVSKDWRVTQDQIIRDHVIPYLCNREMDEIKPPHISKVLEQSKLRGHSARTTRHVYTLLRQMFFDAVEFFEIIQKSPVKQKYHRPKVPKYKAKFLPRELAWILLEAVSDTPFACGVWIQTLTGLRVGEMLPLKWSDIDFDTAQIHVTKIYKKTSKLIQNYTKNKTQHSVPMPPDLMAFLRKRKGRGEDLVMPNSLGEVTCYYVYRRALRRICDRLKLPARSTHGLRHTCSALWRQSGAGLDDVKELFNHASLISTESYDHFPKSRLTELAVQVTKKKQTA